MGFSFGSVFLASSLVALSPVRSVCLQKSQDRGMQQGVLVQKMGVFSNLSMSSDRSVWARVCSGVYV